MLHRNAEKVQHDLGCVDRLNRATKVRFLRFIQNAQTPISRLGLTKDNLLRLNT